MISYSPAPDVWLATARRLCSSTGALSCVGTITDKRGIDCGGMELVAEGILALGWTSTDHRSVDGQRRLEDVLEIKVAMLVAPRAFGEAGRGRAPAAEVFGPKRDPVW